MCSAKQFARLVAVARKRAIGLTNVLLDHGSREDQNTNASDFFSELRNAIREKNKTVCGASANSESAPTLGMWLWAEWMDRPTVLNLNKHVGGV